MNGFFEHQYLSYKRRHMMNLIALARTDGNFHDKEMENLYKICKKYQLKEKHISALLSSDTSKHENYNLTHNQIMEQFFDLVEMMLADGVIEDSEVKFCENMIEYLGYSTQLLNKLIDFVQCKIYDVQKWSDFKDEAILYKNAVEEI